MRTLDKTDVAILDVLKKNARLSTRQIARKSGVPPATVHKRMRKLEAEGIIRNYTVDVDRAKLGLDILAYILVKIKPATDYTSMMKDMEKHEEVVDMGALAGQFDIILKINVGSIRELDDFVMQYVRKFDEVAQTQTLIVFKHWQ